MLERNRERERERERCLPSVEMNMTSRILRDRVFQENVRNRNRVSHCSQRICFMNVKGLLSTSGVYFHCTLCI